jgi:hypothetical protein
MGCMVLVKSRTWVKSLKQREYSPQRHRGHREPTFEPRRHEEGTKGILLLSLPDLIRQSRRRAVHPRAYTWGRMAGTVHLGPYSLASTPWALHSEPYSRGSGLRAVRLGSYTSGRTPLAGHPWPDTLGPTHRQEAWASTLGAIQPGQHTQERTFRAVRPGFVDQVRERQQRERSRRVRSAPHRRPGQRRMALIRDPWRDRTRAFHGPRICAAAAYSAEAAASAAKAGPLVRGDEWGASGSLR